VTVLEHNIPEGTKLAELHVHLGSSVDPAVMWEIAHAQGFRLPTKDYWKFVKMITVDPKIPKSFEDYLAMFKWTEAIQSSPLAIEESVYHTIAGAYRKNNITRLELRFNPMKRNREGERDIDHIMMAALRGVDTASLQYPVQAGIIVCLDRTFPQRQNEILAEKAIKYRSRGVVGIDIAGASKRTFRYADCKAIYKGARDAGLGLTVHAGEDEGPESVIDVIQHLSPDRIGHGVRAAQDPKVMEMIRDQGVTLEVCPSSNLHTRVVKDLRSLRTIFDSFRDHRVKYTINTDGPEMLRTNLRMEFGFLIRNRVLTVKEALRANDTAFSASFLRR
jgi:adenosine deaminase